MDYGRNLYPQKQKKSSRSVNGREKAYKPKPPFIAVEGTESEAYKRLSRDAVWLLMEFYKKFNGYNRCNLCVTYSEVKGRIANGTFNKAIWELIGFGFLDEKRQGRLEHQASIYGLSDRWRTLTLHKNRLDRISRLLRHFERTKRIRTPNSLDEEARIEFTRKRRTLMRSIQYKIVGRQNMAKDIREILPSGVIRSSNSLRSSVIENSSAPPGNSSSLPDDVENKPK